MDKNELIVLKADLATQLALIEGAFERLEDRARDLNPHDIKQLESVAYQLHNVYNAIEGLLELVAAHFENHIADKVRWHTGLLQRMTQPIAGVRPRLLSEEASQLLDVLRGFRHFFRHAYAAIIDPVQLESNLVKTRRLRQLLTQEIDQFLKQLEE
jgi:hypothetical protein